MRDKRRIEKIMSKYPPDLNTFFKTGHISSTSTCPLKCFMCDGLRTPNYPKNVNLEISAFKKAIPYAPYFSLTGCAGDFIYYPHGLEMLELLQDKGFILETNGSLKNDAYWRELAKLSKKKNHTIQFVIDDVVNEFNLYRGSKTADVLNNFRIFTECGGNASVKLILFKFNEDQINKMKTLFAGTPFYWTYSFEYNEDFPAPTDAPEVYKMGTSSFRNKLDIDWKEKSKSFKHCPAISLNPQFVLVENGELHICSNLNIFDFNDTEKYTEELRDLYVKNKELINLNNVEFEDAWYNEYTQHLINNFSNIPECLKNCYFRSKSPLFNFNKVHKFKKNKA